MTSIQAVLFDLDGTLLDTAPDLVYALNRLRGEHQLDPLPLESLRTIVGLGAKTMLKQAFNIEDHHPDLPELRERFIHLYQQHLADSSGFFPKIDTVLTYLEENHIPWGIVTNKLTHHTLALLDALRLIHRPGCIVCGDTLATHKPDPAPILHACKLLKQDPIHCVYIGDAATDVIASKAAGTKSLVALYGYIHANENPYSWEADGYIQEANEIIDWLQKYPQT